MVVVVGQEQQRDDCAQWGCGCTSLGQAGLCARVCGRVTRKFTDPASKLPRTRPS